MEKCGLAAAKAREFDTVIVPFSASFPVHRNKVPAAKASCLASPAVSEGGFPCGVYGIYAVNTGRHHAADRGILKRAGHRLWVTSSSFGYLWLYYFHAALYFKRY
jgi:hypothetical protein